jgi:hypothetical protein
MLGNFECAAMRLEAWLLAVADPSFETRARTSEFGELVRHARSSG